MHMSPVNLLKNMWHEKQDGHLNENSLPSISKSSLKKIRAHDFVNFDLLLSQPLSSPAYLDSQVPYNINFSGKTGFPCMLVDHQSELLLIYFHSLRPGIYIYKPP